MVTTDLSISTHVVPLRRRLVRTCRRRRAVIANSGPGERSDFVFHAADDPAREVKLAFLPFFLPGAG